MEKTDIPAFMPGYISIADHMLTIETFDGRKIEVRLPKGCKWLIKAGNFVDERNLAHRYTVGVRRDGCVFTFDEKEGIGITDGTNES